MNRLLSLVLSLILAGACSFTSPTPAAATFVSVTGGGEATVLSPAPPGFLPGSTSYLFNFNDLVSPSANRLPDAIFSENKLQATLTLIAGFGPAGALDPIVADQQVEFKIVGEFWELDLTLTLEVAGSFPLFTFDSGASTASDSI